MNLSQTMIQALLCAGIIHTLYDSVCKAEGAESAEVGVVFCSFTRTQVIFIKVLGCSHIFLKRNDQPCC